MNREVTVTLTECTVFIFTWRTLERQPLQIELNGPIYRRECVEIVLWQIGESDVKSRREKKKLAFVWFNRGEGTVVISLLNLITV